MSESNQLSNGTSTVNVGNMPNGSSEQVLANAVTTFALQLPTTVQGIIKSGILTIVVIQFVLSIIMCSVSLYTIFYVSEKANEMEEIYRKVDDRHQRMTQYAKEHDYKILTKEAR